ncbi:DUF2332 domain-containing protein [Microlunatus sp. Y2014]|uniref:DUF2332 domain-containing protein n=1 Tax=Microlunatus sp. Y2014 TaxID=3418488 RepID=UPI003DA6D3A5
MEVYGNTRQLYEAFRVDAADSPCFADWSAGVVADEQVLAWLDTLPDGKRQPNLVFAAARWHGVPAPGPYEGLRSALLADDGTIRETIMERRTQTNEVGRLATLVPALAGLGLSDPIALLEVGPSAGLCLYPDRWSYAWGTEAGVVTAGSGPALSCQVSGPAPLPTITPRIGWRGGIDLNPLDVTDADAMAWLRMLVWPEQHDRLAALDAGITIAATDPPDLRTGDLLTGVADLVAEASAYGPVVVFHSAVIAYLTRADRDRFAGLMAELVTDGRCHWISNEGRQVLPDIGATSPPAPDQPNPFVLGVDGRAVARTHGHGRSMVWLG